MPPVRAFSSTLSLTRFCADDADVGLEDGEDLSAVKDRASCVGMFQNEFVELVAVDSGIPVAPSVRHEYSHSL